MIPLNQLAKNLRSFLLRDFLIAELIALCIANTPEGVNINFLGRTAQAIIIQYYWMQRLIQTNTIVLKKV